MALSRRFYDKPPDHLLEISERIHVFDCSFSTEVLKEDEYRVYMRGIVAQLVGYHPDSNFMVLNFGEGDKRSQISDILTQYDMQVMEYPQQYEGCPILPLDMTLGAIRSSDSWLSLAEQQNVLLMHCERGGWPVLAFMLAALLLFRKQYNGEKKTLEMLNKLAPRDLLHIKSPFNPQPSQLRYLQYISRRNIGREWPPSETPLTLECIILRFLPSFGKKGFRLDVRIHGQDSSSTTTPSKLLYSSAESKNNARYYHPEARELVKVDIHQRVQGDIVLYCRIEYVGKEMVFRAMFHTYFVDGNALIWGHDEVDVIWWDQMPKDFQAEVLFSAADAQCKDRNEIVTTSPAA